MMMYLRVAASVLAFISTVTADDGNNKIVGGTAAGNNEFPAYAVPAAGETRCGGVLIWDDIIMSAAHCAGVWNEEGKAYIGANSIDGSDSEDDPGVDSEHNHPDHNGDTEENDISLIKLSRCSKVKPAKWNSNESEPKTGDPVTACGFGDTTDGGSPSDDLLKVTVNVQDIDQCVSEHDNEGETVFPELMLCASDTSKDTCQGDSGGPLFVDGTDTVVGIVSWGLGCAGSTAGVYTRVAHYDDYIEETICKLTRKKPDWDCPCSILPSFLSWIPFLGDFTNSVLCFFFSRFGIFGRHGFFVELFSGFFDIFD